MDKSNQMNFNLEKWLRSEEFGSGEGSISAYETAMAAMLHEHGELTKPSFNQSLNWIRENQMTDGSWGAEFPFSIFDRIISTFKAIICLKKWKIKGDQELINKGLIFIRSNQSSLGSIEEMENKMTGAFELLIFMCMKEAGRHGIEIIDEKIFEIFKKEYSIKIKKILSPQTILEVETCPWTMSLEGCGELYTNEKIAELIHPETYLINCSYSATIFALMRGVFSQNSLNQLSETIRVNNGGVPISYPLETFDLAWSITYLIWSGYSIGSEFLKPHIDKLENNWNLTNGLVSAHCSSSSGSLLSMTPDADVISMTIFVLSSDKRIKGLESLKSLLKYHKKNYFITWPGEKRISYSVNIHVLNALRNYQDEDSLVEIRNNVYNWLKNEIKVHDFKIQDKWHYSTYYPITRALIALDYIDPEFSDQIYLIILKKQNEDGGWGDLCSTALETSMVIISINYWNEKNYGGQDKRAWDALMKARLYMTNVENQEIGKFWLQKTLYSLENLDKTIILGAKFVLYNFNESY